MKLQYTAILAIGLMTFQAVAQDQKPAPTAPPAAPAAAEPPDMNKVHTALGMFFGGMLKRNAPEVNVDEIAKVMKDVLAGKPATLDEKDMNATLMGYTKFIKDKISAKNKLEGEAFLAKNAKEAGVKVLTVTNSLNGKSSSLQYLVMTEGTGPKPKRTDTVTVNYKGMFMDGSEFDSSKQPFETPVSSRVIKGWQEVLPEMPVGSKWKVFIPADLGYGENGNQRIPGNSVLIFEMELLSIKAPQEINQGVSGEIIKVPSAEDLKKGAKIEVIKPGQTNVVETK